MVWFFFFAFGNHKLKPLWVRIASQLMGAQLCSRACSRPSWAVPADLCSGTPLLPAATGPSGFQLAKSSAKPGAWLTRAQLAFWGGLLRRCS